jgi:hypothetical protein
MGAVVSFDVSIEGSGDDRSHGLVMYSSQRRQQSAVSPEVHLEYLSSLFQAHNLTEMSSFHGDDQRAMGIPQFLQPPLRTQSAFHPVDFFSLLYAGMVQNMMEADGLQSGTPGVDKQAFYDLVRKRLSADQLASQNDCAICLDVFKMEEVIELPCGDIFIEYRACSVCCV